MRTCHIIVAGCDAHRRRDLRRVLEFERYSVTEAATAASTVEETCSGSHDMLILDSGTGDIDPCRVCRLVRPVSDLGILILTATDAVATGIEALNAGADDVVPGPLAAAELLARVRAIRRRIGRSEEGSESVILPDRSIDMRAHKVYGPGQQIGHLTPKEFMVLKHLVTRSGETVTNRELAQTVWQRHGCQDYEYIRVVIGQLRRKIEANPDDPQHLITERSRGYRFRAAPNLSGPLADPSQAHKTDNPATAQ